ncbi:MAG: hypothetical protein WCH30_05115 [Chlorobiaceae bacterium]
MLRVSWRLRAVSRLSRWMFKHRGNLSVPAPALFKIVVAAPDVDLKSLRS